MAQEDRAGVRETRQEPLRVGRGNVQVLRRDQVRDRDRLVFVSNQDDRPEPLEAVAGQVAPAQSASWSARRA